MIKIGNIEIDTRAILGPMAGCTDLAYRVISKENGCKFGFSEMIDASGLVHRHYKTLEILKTNSKDLPIAVQILGDEPVETLEAAYIVLENFNPMFIDLNFACPAKKVLKKNAGASLIKDPKRAGRIVKKLSDNLHLPITTKIRTGWNDNSGKEVLKLAKTVIDSGAKAIFVHGRSMSQGYSGKANYNAIALIKKNVTVPVIGSGDIFSYKSAKDMLDKTDCAGVLVARGSYGSPWLCRDIEDHLLGKEVKYPTKIKIKNTAKKHIALFLEYKNRQNRHLIGPLRKITMWYTKGQQNASKLRNIISQANTYEDLVDIINNF